jgi:predicted ATP-grasp superfamily ATP-dependent carboligase
MNIMVAEYAVGAGESGTILLEGKAMLNVLVNSFMASGHNVIYPTSGPVLSTGTAVWTDDLEQTIESLAGKCDAGLVIAPDELLENLTRLVEENTVNLGCSSGSVRLCADKLLTSEALTKAAIKVPRTAGVEDRDVFAPGEMVVIKPRWGCASENTALITYNKSTHIPDGFILTQYIEGEHISASLIAADNILPLSVNRQNIIIESTIQYNGSVVGIDSGRNTEVFEAAQRSVRVLGCRGYVGVDIVLADEPWVVDVNPRPTTSIIGIDRVMDAKLGELIIQARFGGLPGSVQLKDEFAFTKADLEQGNPC